MSVPAPSDKVMMKFGFFVYEHDVLEEVYPADFSKLTPEDFEEIQEDAQDHLDNYVTEVVVELIQELLEAQSDD